ncbi:acyl-CoA/acyl-ACP dehydrogenase [Pseudomonadales bacterium]|nr:acyl-CoA/acyl-ACP dehydrogenase [Pseudomonadales bacterium]
MNEEQQLIGEMARRMLDDHCGPAVVDAAEQGDYPSALWTLLVDNGLTTLGIDEALGGAGGTFGDALVVLREAGRKAAPLPLAETLLAGQLFSSLEQRLPTGPMCFVQGDVSLNESGQLQGSVHGVKFARHCQTLLVAARRGEDPVVCLIPAATVAVTQGKDLAGEPSDDLELFVQVQPQACFEIDEAKLDAVLVWGAAMRSVMMAGALEEALAATVGYALERKQFGKAIAKFQAIQQQLAVFATQVAASTRAAETLMVQSEIASIDVAIAKARIGEAAGICAEIAHQVHGAIGYTRDHRLNHLTRRLWAWRDAFGHEAYWQERLGRTLLADQTGDLWQQVTALG